MAYNTIFSKIRKSKGNLVNLKAKSQEKKERSKTGFEVEFLLVDKEGKVSNDADKVLGHIEREDLKHEAVKECCHSYVEMGVYPRIYVRTMAMPIRVTADKLTVIKVMMPSLTGYFYAQNPILKIRKTSVF
jgi:hypothetical protein